MCVIHSAFQFDMLNRRLVANIYKSFNYIAYYGITGC